MRPRCTIHCNNYVASAASAEVCDLLSAILVIYSNVQSIIISRIVGSTTKVELTTVADVQSGEGSAFSWMQCAWTDKWTDLNIQLNMDDSHASLQPDSAHGFLCPAPAVNSGLSQEPADAACCCEEARMYCSWSLPGIGSDRSWNVSFVHETCRQVSSNLCKTANLPTLCCGSPWNP